jgi:DNA-binding transcriptional MerR regulator
MRQRRIGELAKATGLTVRTLHHYDEIGLLVPAERSASGYRLYGDEDVRRLYRILALRGMGFSLEDVGETLDGEGDDPRPAVRRQLGRLDEQLRQTARLRERLTRILDVLDHSGEPSGDLFIDAIEVMITMEQYYAPEQLDRLEQRRNALGDEGMQRAQQDWVDLIAEFEAERAAGTDPADARVQALVARADDLIEQFTGGDPGIRASLQRVYEDKGAEQASRGTMNAEGMAYMQRAREVRPG